MVKIRLKEKSEHNRGTICCKEELYDGLYIMPSTSTVSGYKAVLERIKSKYDVGVVNSNVIPNSEDKTPLIIRMPDKKRRLFELFIKKGFVARNKEGFLNLLIKLISENVINIVCGSISYDENGEHVFINLNFALNNKDIPFMHKIGRNYESIKCLFKRKNGDTITLFCESRSKIYPFKRDYEIWDYSLDYAEKNGRSSALTNFHVLINRSGNAKFMSNAEKLNILAREFYAKNLNEGVAILTTEMKNLGFDIRIAEKRRCK